MSRLSVTSVTKRELELRERHRLGSEWWCRWTSRSSPAVLIPTASNPSPKRTCPCGTVRGVCIVLNDGQPASASETMPESQNAKRCAKRRTNDPESSPTMASMDSPGTRGEGWSSGGTVSPARLRTQTMGIVGDYAPHWATGLKRIKVGAPASLCARQGRSQPREPLSN